MLKVVQIPCLSDNYGFLVHDEASKQTISIDSPDAQAISMALEQRNWSLSAIWNTHHHFDHVGGNAALQTRWGCEIIAPKGDAAHIEHADHWVGDGDKLKIGNITADIIHTPGHTMGHVIYVFKDKKIAFVGDTLFALGCGRLFEGGPKDMWRSLQKLSALDPQTKIYCAHEYTEDNLRFAQTVDPQNAELKTRGGKITSLRAAGKWTIPFVLAEDIATNPFLRASDPKIREHLGLQEASNWEVFAEIRRRKDEF